MKNQSGVCGKTRETLPLEGGGMGGGGQLFFSLFQHLGEDATTLVQNAQAGGD